MGPGAQDAAEPASAMICATVLNIPPHGRLCNPHHQHGIYLAQDRIQHVLDQQQQCEGAEVDIRNSGQDIADGLQQWLCHARQEIIDFPYNWLARVQNPEAQEETEQAGRQDDPGIELYQFEQQLEHDCNQWANFQNRGLTAQTSVLERGSQYHVGGCIVKNHLRDTGRLDMTKGI